MINIKKIIFTKNSVESFEKSYDLMFCFQNLVEFIIAAYIASKCQFKKTLRKFKFMKIKKEIK